MMIQAHLCKQTSPSRYHPSSCIPWLFIVNTITSNIIVIAFIFAISIALLHPLLPSVHHCSYFCLCRTCRCRTTIIGLSCCDHNCYFYHLTTIVAVSIVAIITISLICLATAATTSLPFTSAAWLSIVLLWQLTLLLVPQSPLPSFWLDVFKE